MKRPADKEARFIKKSENNQFMILLYLLLTILRSYTT